MVGGQANPFQTSVRRRLRAAVALVATLAVFAIPGVALGDVEEDRNAWLEVSGELTETTQELQALEAQAATAAEDLADAKKRLADARDRLERLRDKLTEAIRRQNKAEAHSDEMVVALGQATRAMVGAREALAAHSADFETEVTAAYKYGGDTTKFARTLEALEESGNITEFLIVEEQLRQGAKTRYTVVEYVSGLAEDLAEREAEVAHLRDRAAAAERIAVRHRTEVATLTREQYVLVGDIAVERRTVKRQLRKLESQQEEYSKRVAELESESEALAAELAQYSGVAGALGDDEMMWPTDGGVTSGFGSRRHPIFKVRRMHTGVDIPAGTGQDVFSSAAGVVVSAGVRGGYGNAVVVQHADGVSTLYGHLSDIDVYSGQTVDQFEHVGDVGSTGNSTGPHLHFEIRVDGIPYDPMSWF